MSDIFDEINEELRRENWLQLWQRYGKYAIMLAVAAVLATAFGIGWTQYLARQHQSEGTRYAAALDLAQQGKDKEAEDAFAAIAEGAGAGRAVLARLEQAALAMKSGDRATAVAIYDALSQDGSAQQTYRDLATLLAARLEVDQNPKEAKDRLLPLTDAKNPYHATALELTAIADLDAGDAKTARATYQRLADDPTVPAGARARAAEMLTALAP